MCFFVFEIFSVLLRCLVVGYSKLQERVKYFDTIRTSMNGEKRKNDTWEVAQYFIAIQCCQFAVRL